MTDLRKQVNTLPITPGVYQFFNADGEILYIGKAINLRNRVKSYFQKNILSPRTKKMVSQIVKIKTVRTDSEFEALLLEAKLIRTHMPKYNVVWRDDKHPLYIKITHDEFPKIRTVRREDDTKSTYFGPFPSSGVVKDTLRFLREIVPYCSDTKINKRACFYEHIGLCDPCPNRIVQLEGASERARETKRYRDNIGLIKKLLDGKAPSVIRQFERQMIQAAKKEDYKKAALVKRRLDKLLYLRQKRTPVREYMSNPNLYDDMRHEEQKALAAAIGFASAAHIEGYDISNTQGTHAVGSMVTFENGEPDKSMYRRFKIRLKDSPDDTFMMYEVLVRRLRHEDWPLPDLIMVDGGKGQITAALAALKKQNKDVPLIGLAKQHEEIIIPQQGNTYKIIRLPKDSPGLHLIQRVRDEAHRFANTYHRNLRSKNMI